MSRKKEDPEAAPIKDLVIEEFLNAQSRKTRKCYTSQMKKVLEFSKGETGQSMIDNVKLWSRKIMAFRQYLIDKEYSLNSVECMTGMLRGFFSYYKVPLDLSKADKVKLGRKARNSEDYSFSQTDLKTLNSIASLDEKYVLLGGVSFGLRAEDFVKLTYGKYRLALERAKQEDMKAPIPLGEINTSKEDVKAYPLISSDALPIIQTILDTHKNAKDEDPVYESGSYQLTSSLQTLVHKSGIDTHGQRVRFHCLRKFLFDRIVSVSSTAKGNQIVGHKVSGEIAAYIGVGGLREVYERTEPSISISGNGNGETKAKVSILEQQNKDLLEKNKVLEDQLKKLQREQSHTTSSTASNETRINELESKLDKLTKLLEGKT